MRGDSRIDGCPARFNELHALPAHRLPSSSRPTDASKACPHFCPAMQLPSLVPGQRFTLPRPPGAADALLIARLASDRAAQGQLTLVVCAEPADSQRLADELPFFAPHVRVAIFPAWETRPYAQFSPHQDLVSERLATLWRLYRKSQGISTANT